MKRYLDAEIALIKERRKKYKYSYHHLSHLYGIPSSTIRNWCFDDRIHTKGDILRAFYSRKREEIKKSEAQEAGCVDYTKGAAKLYAATMYWCEGAKYPASNAMKFTNADAVLLRTFISLLRKGFRLDEKKFRVHLQVHAAQEYETLRKYWSNLLGIPIAQFAKPTVTNPGGKKHRIQYNGTCTLKYQDYRLQLKLVGLYEEFARRIGSPLT